jgi:hypothetical protein
VHINPAAPVVGIRGTWAHTAELRASRRLPFALARFGLLPPVFDGAWGTAGAQVVTGATRTVSTSTTGTTAHCSGRVRVGAVAVESDLA